MTRNRENGVDFGDLQDDLGTATYPLSSELLLEEFGDRVMSHASGSVTVRELLEPLGTGTYASPAEVQQELMNMVGEGAIGRKDYTDRGGQEQAVNYEEESF